MKKWQCSVCNYIHEGEEPPEKCPICGADRNKFVEFTENGNASEDNTETGTVEVAPSTISEKITTFILANHIHPITIHGPNGIIPMAVLFLVLAAVLQLPGFGNAAYLSLIFVLLSMPPVLLSGYLTWQKKYKGAKTSVFKIKIASSCVATIILIGLIAWKTARPDILGAASLYSGSCK